MKAGKSGFLGSFMVFLFALLLVGVGIFVFNGPAGIANKYANWKANFDGSDWLVVQYAVDGKVINHWKLKDVAIHSESHSDGIFFTTAHGVVHLSGHYLYVQNPTEEAEVLYLKK